MMLTKKQEKQVNNQIKKTLEDRFQGLKTSAAQVFLEQFWKCVTHVRQLRILRISARNL